MRFAFRTWPPIAFVYHADKALYVCRCAPASNIVHLEGEKHVPVLKCSHQSHYFKFLKLESSEFSVVQNMFIAVFVFE